MDVVKKIDPFYFIMAFGIGMYFNYISSPKIRVIKVFPNPHNVNQKIYRDEAGNCYKYQMRQTACNGEEIKIPLSM